MTSSYLQLLLQLRPLAALLGVVLGAVRLQAGGGAHHPALVEVTDLGDKRDGRAGDVRGGQGRPGAESGGQGR